jgi:site-specific DNA recombinase
MRRAALYARVSTRHQEQEATIESQLAQVLGYAEQHDLEVPVEHQFVDQAVSGQQLARPGLDRLRDAAAAHAFTVLLCLSPDRLARNLAAQQVVLQELTWCGVEVIFLNQPTLADSPQTQLLLNIQGAFAEYERVLISERMRRGRLYRLRQGQSVPSQAPYGYRFHPATRHEPSCWVTVPAEAAVVQAFFVEYTQGGLTLGQLARQLNERRVPSPEGKRWQRSTLGRLLRQPAYKGTAYYNRHQRDHSTLGQARRQGRGSLRFPRNRLRPVEEWIEVRVSAIVDEALWQAAQERLAMQARFARRNSRRAYLLRGLLVCGICGHTLQGRTQADIVTYECVHGSRHRPVAVPKHTCRLRADVVEPLVWEALAELLHDPERIQGAWDALQADPSTADELSRWRQRQAALQKQRQRLLDAYQAELISLQELSERQQPINAELAELEKQLAVSAQRQAPPLSLEAFTQHIQRALAASDIETRQEVLRLLIERIVVTDETLTVEHIVPTVNSSRLYPTCRTA